MLLTGSGSGSLQNIPVLLVVTDSGPEIFKHCATDMFRLGSIKVLIVLLTGSGPEIFLSCVADRSGPEIFKSCVTYRGNFRCSSVIGHSGSKHILCQRCLCLALLDRFVYFMQQDLVSNHCLLEVQSCYRQVHFMLVLVYLLPASRHVHNLLASMAC